MIICQADDANKLFVEVLKSIQEHGVVRERRGGKVKEVHPMLCILNNPTKNVMVMLHRSNNFFATLYETFWVLSGHNDIKALSYFLPRAPEYSDDFGHTWRGAYGPRLRGRFGRRDSLMTVIELLRKDPWTQRAAIAIYENGLDFVESRDVPCNLMLHFLSPDGESLDLEVFNRSNDAWFGYSGINLFEWTTLLRLVAWLSGLKVGRYYHFTSNMHVYERHWQKMEKIIANSEVCSLSVYDRGCIVAPFDLLEVDTGKLWDVGSVLSFISVMTETVDRFITGEAPLQNWRGLIAEVSIKAYEDPLFKIFGRIIPLCRSYQFFKKLGKDGQLAMRFLDSAYLPDFPRDDWYLAAEEFFGHCILEKKL